MTVFVLSTSVSFEQHLSRGLRDEPRLRFNQSARVLCESARGRAAVSLVHAPSYPNALPQMLQALSGNSALRVGVATDRPNLKEMLELFRFGIVGYFNSYMADVHYVHLLTLLRGGQTWFSPGLLNRALELAREAIQKPNNDDLLKPLTPRECEIARDVAQGLGNKHIADVRCITESTVKAHLTYIFKKLHIPDRTSLAIRLSESA